MNHEYRYLLETRFNNDRLQELRDRGHSAQVLVDLASVPELDGFARLESAAPVVNFVIPLLAIAGSCLAIAALT